MHMSEVKRMTFRVDPEIHAKAKENTERGDISEALRETMQELAENGASENAQLEERVARLEETVQELEARTE